MNRELPSEESQRRYEEFFVLFNKGAFFEAHEVLEPVWLASRTGPDGLFYKGLIQLAGAFVHVQKRRKAPAQALFRLAEQNLCRYPVVHNNLEMRPVIGLVKTWLQALELDQLEALAPLICLRK